MSTGDVDLLLDDLDRSLGRGASYADLFRRWEEQQWSVTALDLTRDREGWLALEPARQVRLRWALTQFFQGEEAVTVSLAPFVDAAPAPEQQLFLTTQLVDEARHAVLFQRVFSEVVALEERSLGGLLDRTRPDVTPGYAMLFGLLDEATERIRVERSVEALVRGVTVYHLLVEGTVALTGQRHILDWLRRENALPGFREGFTHVTRDESRHVAFGVALLREAIADEPAAADVVRETVLAGIPAVLGTLEPPGGDGSYYTTFGFSQDEVAQWALDSLRRKLQAVGVTIDGLTS
ncbi:MAG: ribonucleotide-diphosphate reductase subunit beta [Gaiella sp.]